MVKEDIATIELFWFGGPDMAWSRDEPYHNREYCYFDIETKKIVFISKPKLERNEDEAVKLYKKVSNNPKRYIEIPTLKHEKHHEIFDKYKSNLPVEQELEDKILNCCNPLSIGGFKKDLKENFSLEIYKKVWYGWQNFKNKELSKIAKKWFKEQGYIVNWK